MTPPNFEDFYAYAFKYCLTGELGRHLPFLNISLHSVFQDNVLLSSLSLSLSHTHTHFFSQSDIDEIFRRDAKVCRRWDHLWIAESCSGFPILCPGWFDNWVSKGRFLVYVDGDFLCFVISTFTPWYVLWPMEVFSGSSKVITGC